ncbi:hypothetical protein BDK51DRAFT_30770 [Blyttiomyces helicus]|uniref:Uncharacterized protein n=1 Tax=Blyttiomyces helicus TaxID=388810 RepID=A0A4P9VYY4_9FUNG|nr:hypothetical protein BDK51DRAFT_30770 [Blyttiomyces helicus]|eukprot:RKO84185.1 hypothetical protein BDK51DRAFT_30770 [Blyttiomyces helicus]
MNNQQDIMVIMEREKTRQMEVRLEMAKMGINIEPDPSPPMYSCEETNTLANDNTHLADEKIFDFVKNHYELSDNDEDYILFSDMLKLYKEKSIDSSSRPRLTVAVKRFGVTHISDNFGRTSTFRGKTGYGGLKLKCITNESITV